MQEEKTWKPPSGVQAEVVQEALRADAMGRPAPTAHGRKSFPPEVTQRSRKTLPERPGHHNRDPDRPAVSTDPPRPHVTIRTWEMIQAPLPYNQTTNAKESEVKRTHV